MAEADKIADDAWRLDDQSVERAEPDPRSTAPTAEIAVADNLSNARLTRAVYVVTAEHLAWYAIAAYALVTRIVALGARPLDQAQATRALAASVIAAHGRAAFALADASWVAIVEGWLFAAFGATDAASRIVVMVCGLLLVAIGFALRPVLGRAGALSFAGLIAISPSMTYFSRGGGTAVASTAFMMIAIAVADGMRRRPGGVRALALGVAIALWLSADPIGYLTAAAVIASLIAVGLADLVRADHRRLRIRVWWARRRALVLVAAIVAAGLWLLATTAFFHRPLVAALEYTLAAAFAPPSIAFEHAIHRLLPVLLFYEFLILSLALVGAAVVVSRNVGDRFAAWSLVWAIMTCAIFAAVGVNRADAVIAIVLPLAIVGAYAIDWMHQSERWNSIRYPLAAAAALTLYIQCVTNFVYPAPDASEAAWRRHALLFWSEPATSIQTVRECRRARNAASPAGASAAIPDDAPQVQWYLRDFAPAVAPGTANIVVTVGSTQSGAAAGNPDASQFGFEEWWTPDFRKLTIADALRYLFTQRVWSDVEIRDLRIALTPGKPGP